MKEAPEPLPSIKEKRSAFLLILLTLGITVSLVIFWQAASVFFLLFASILLAIVFQTISHFLSRVLKIPYQPTLIIVVLSLLVLLSLFFWISTPLIGKQLTELFNQVPAAFNKVRETLLQRVGEPLLKEGNLTTELLKNDALFQQIGAIFTSTVGLFVGLFFIAFVSIYLAYNPKMYIDGFLNLFPKNKRAFPKQAIHSMGEVLRLWLFSKCISMTVIGVLTTVGLWLLHVPLAFILGLLAGILTFIPYLGAIIASVPAILIGLSISPWMALYVTLLFVGIHALEGYLITPIVEQKTVSLPPALTIFVQIILSILTGFLGLALASPITLVGLILVKLYVKERDRVDSLKASKG